MAFTPILFKQEKLQQQEKLQPTWSDRLSTLTKYWMLFPALLITWVVVIFPLMYSFYIGMTDYYLPEPHNIVFVGFKNYLNLFHDSRFWQATVNTFLLYTAALTAEYFLGFLLALLLDSNIRAGNFFRALMMIPLMIPPSVVGLQFRWLFNDQFGFLAHIPMKLGLSNQPLAWLASSKTALLAILVTEIWQFTPFMALILLAGLRSLPTEVLEAARVDGAGYWKRVHYIIIPMLKSIMLIALFIRTIDIMRIFDLILLMTRGGPGYSTEIMGTMIYRVAMREAEFGYGAALSSFAVVGIFLTVVIPMFRMLWKSMAFEGVGVQ